MGTSYYSPEWKLRSVIEDNPELLDTLTRFGISYGFGDKNVADVCREDNVDTSSFLAVCNLISGNEFSSYAISLSSLMKYLRNAHVHFLDYVLPSIRLTLIEAISKEDINDVTFLLLRFFDDYVEEVRRHMTYENNIVFRYVDDLQSGNIPSDFRISEYSAIHDSLTDKLNALKDVFIRHYHVKGNELITSALTGIINCGKALRQHCEVENMLFTPAVERLEKKLKIKEIDKQESEKKNEGDNNNIKSLTEREKEIIGYVAKGLSNKEIAAKLYISVHTVTTYRRNIAAKLEIHSPAGLTIFAIINGLIDINEATSK